MHESDYIRAVNKYLPPEITHLKLSLRFRKGVPDSLYMAAPNKYLWIEWKYDHEPPKNIVLANKKKYLTKLQQDFLIERHEQKHKTAVVYATAHGGILIPTPDWETPITREHYLTHAERHKDLIFAIKTMLYN